MLVERARAQPRRERASVSPTTRSLAKPAWPAGKAGRRCPALEHGARNRGGALDAAVLPLRRSAASRRASSPLKSRRAPDRECRRRLPHARLPPASVHRCCRSIEPAGRLPVDVDRARIPSSSAGTPNGRPILRRSPSSPLNVLSHRAVSMPPSPSRPEASSRPCPPSGRGVRSSGPCHPMQPRRRRQLERHARDVGLDVLQVDEDLRSA